MPLILMMMALVLMQVKRKNNSSWTLGAAREAQPPHWGWFEMEYDDRTPPGGGWFEMYGNWMKNGFNPLEPPGAGPRKRG